MKLDYETHAYIAWNLEDALEELSRINEMFRPEVEIDEAEFKVRMAHLFSHINTAWNVRTASAEEIDSASGEKLRTWSRFPADLEPSP
jgi:hypothetical protein